ncbi:hypothetical protein VTH06DRAFT_5019 [Thermothelomyces fergusii]
MNADHRADMRHILMHYGADPPVPPSYFTDGGADPLMLDIDLDRFTVRLPATDGVHAVAFDPPLRSWADRRERLVAMTRAAREAATPPSSSSSSSPGDGAAVVVVDEYMAPRVPWDLAVFVAVLVYYASLALVRAGLAGPGGGGAAAERALDAARFPGGAAGFRWLVDALALPVLGIHLAETWWLERSRLRRFGVRRGSRVWWLWVGSVFIEGAMAFRRFDIVVERLRREREEEEKKRR